MKALIRTVLPLLLLLLGCIVGCSKAEKEPRTTAAPPPEWATALSAHPFEYKAVLDSSKGTEVSITLQFGKAVGAGDQLRLPVTLKYTGPQDAEGNIVDFAFIDEGGVQHDVRAKGTSTLPASGAARELELQPTFSRAASKLTVDVRLVRITLERTGNTWKLTEDAAMKRFAKDDKGKASARELCDQIASAKCEAYGGRQTDHSVGFNHGEWSVQYCPEGNCSRRCKELEELMGTLGGKGPWMRADSDFCVAGPVGEASKETETAVAKVIAKPTLSRP